MSNKRLIDGEALLEYIDEIFPTSRGAFPLFNVIESIKIGQFDIPNQGEVARLQDELEDQRARANIAHANAEAKSARLSELHVEVARLREALENIAFGRIEGDYSDVRQYAREALEVGVDTK